MEEREMKSFPEFYCRRVDGRSSVIIHQRFNDNDIEVIGIYPKDYNDDEIEKSVQLGEQIVFLLNKGIIKVE